MKTGLLFAISIAVIVSCMALDCPECNRNLCKDVGPCPFGETRDVCYCCPVCYKGPNEKCGGPWNVFGLCAKHLVCVKLPGKKNPNTIELFNAAGKCQFLIE